MQRVQSSAPVKPSPLEEHSSQFPPEGCLTKGQLKYAWAFERQRWHTCLNLHDVLLQPPLRLKRQQMGSPLASLVSFPLYSESWSLFLSCWFRAPRAELPRPAFPRPRPRPPRGGLSTQVLGISSDALAVTLSEKGMIRWRCKTSVSTMALEKAASKVVTSPSRSHL